METKTNCALRVLMQFSFDPEGRRTASISDDGILLVSDVDTNQYLTHYTLGGELESKVIIVE